MRSFLSFIIVFVKIFVAVKVTILLFMTKSNPEEYPISDLIWWIGFLVFDMWVVNQLPDSITEDKDTTES